MRSGSRTLAAAIAASLLLIAPIALSAGSAAAAAPSSVRSVAASVPYIDTLKVT